MSSGLANQMTCTADSDLHISNLHASAWPVGLTWPWLLPDLTRSPNRVYWARLSGWQYELGMVDWCFEPRMALMISTCYLLNFDAVPDCSTGSCVIRLRSWSDICFSFGHRSCLLNLAEISVHLSGSVCSADWSCRVLHLISITYLLISDFLIRFGLPDAT